MTKKYAFTEQKGRLPFSFRNDLMFKLVLQGNKKVLMGLLCSLLHLKREEIMDAEILNPYLIGHTAADKTCVLDIRVMLNASRIINLEMQVVSERDWIDRSVYYLCRMHDQLARGADYKDAKPTLHIGIIAFDLDFFPEKNKNEFYAEHVLMNKRTHKIYSSKIGLNVLNLSHVEDATEEERASGLYGWARLFNATTWEELKIMAEKEKIYAEAADELYQHSLNEREAIDLLSHEMGLMDQQVRERRWRESELQMEKMNKELKEKRAELEGTKTELEGTKTELEGTRTELEGTRTELEDVKKKIAEYEARLKTAGLL